VLVPFKVTVLDPALKVPELDQLPLTVIVLDEAVKVPAEIAKSPPSVMVFEGATVPAPTLVSPIPAAPVIVPLKFRVPESEPIELFEAKVIVPW
jgi:hypothetical protein